MKVLILGADGMLGLGVTAALTDSGHELGLAHRRSIDLPIISSAKSASFDAGQISVEELTAILTGADYVINCIGTIKPRIQEENEDSIRNAELVNSNFPKNLAAAAKLTDSAVIQIATDCVFSGRTGSYDEASTHDPDDVYGKSKSQGEIDSPQVMHIRTSIVGPELERSTSLFEWFRNQPKNAELRGFTNHLWNGLTTWHFGKVVNGIIDDGLFEPGVQHLVPSNRINKYELLCLFQQRTGRDDISIKPFEADLVVDRSLETRNPGRNKELWKAAGYDSVPSIEQIIGEMPLNYDRK